MKAQQRGFTLVELIVVIVILGILAATALPRFLNVTTDAHKAAVRGFGGGVISAIGTVQGQWIAAGTNPASVTMADTTVITTSTTTGLPTAASTGIGRAIRCIDTDCNGFTASYAATTTFTPLSYGTSTCRVEYVEATGAVTSLTSGCP